MRPTASLGDALDRLRASLPLHIREQWERDEAKERELCESLRTNCYDAIGRLADAMRSPRVSLHDIEEAIAMLTVARDCAKALDQ